MKKLFLLLILFFVGVNSYAQFTLNGADDYLRKKAEIVEAQRVQDSIRQAQIEEQQMMANDIRFRMKWINMVTLRQSIGFVGSSYNLSYYGYLLTKDKWNFPISLRISGSHDFNESAMNSGYKDREEWLTDLGLSGFRKVKGNMYFGVGGHGLIGREKYRLDTETSTDKKHWHLLLGLSAEERLMYISPNRVGLMMGCGLYQQIINSKSYTFEAGFSFEVGIKF
jgi:hypothetical protein